MSEPDVEEELRALAELSARFLQDLGPEDRCASRIVWHLVRLARHAEQRLEFQVHRPRGWSWAGFRIMINAYALGSVEPSQLAAILGVARPTITSNVDKLERDGLLRRTIDPSNRRRVRIELTANGRAAVEEVSSLHLRVERELVSGIGRSERVQLEAILHSLLRSLPPISEKTYEAPD